MIKRIIGILMLLFLFGFTCAVIVGRANDFKDGIIVFGVVMSIFAFSGIVAWLLAT